VTAKGKTVLVHAGETTTIPFGEAPAEVAPSKIPLSYTDNFRIEGSLQGLESLVELPTNVVAEPKAPVVRRRRRRSRSPRLRRRPNCPMRTTRRKIPLRKRSSGLA